MDFEDEESPQQARKGPKKRFRKNKLKLEFNIEDRKNFLLGFRKRKQERKEKYIEKLERDLVKEKKRIKQQTQRSAKNMSSSHSILPEVKSIIENMPEKEETYDLGNTLVSITSLDDQIYRNLPVKKEESSDEESDPREKERRAKQLVKKLKNESERKLRGEESDDDELSAIARNDPFFNPINDDELSRSDLSEEEEEINYNPLEMLRKSTRGDTDACDPTNVPSKAKLEKQANRMLQESEIFKKMQRIKQKRSKKFRLFRLQPTETATDGPKGTSGGKGSKGKTVVGKGGKSKLHKRGKRK